MDGYVVPEGKREVCLFARDRDHYGKSQPIKIQKYAVRSQCIPLQNAPTPRAHQPWSRGGRIIVRARGSGRLL